MNSNQFIQYSDNYSYISNDEVKELESLVSNFPYFQSARALYLKGLFNINSYRYNFELKKTAALTTERDVLFEFITAKEFNKQSVKKININEINVIDFEIIRFLPPKEEVNMIQENINEIISDNNVENILFNIEEEETIISDNVNFEIKAEESYNSKIEVEETIISNNINSKFNEEKEIEIELEFLNLNSKIFEITDETFTVDLPEKENIKNDFNADEAPFVINFEPIVEKLKIGKPLPFEREEKHSFFEWLRISQIKPIERSTEREKEEIEVKNNTKILEINYSKSKKNILIDQFLASNPKIIPSKNSVDSPIKIIETTEKQHLMTETLARVYIEQKKYNKAIEAFQILILKNPEKSVYFADRIKDIKILQQNNL